jgi:membrane protease YdiL (CAAX protease family)
VIESWQAPERHSLTRTLALHLGPGALLTLAFLLGAPQVGRAGGSSYLALLLCIPLVLVPVEVGILVVEGRRIGHRWWSLTAWGGGSRLSIGEVLLSGAALYVIAMAPTLLIAPWRSVVLGALPGWLPPWVIVDSLPVGVSQGTLWLGLAFSGLVAPVVEELYFRGFLLARIPVGGAWAPAVNTALFSIYHFFSPWNYAVIFMAFLPLAYYVRLRGRLLPVIISRCFFNGLRIAGALAGVS